MAFSTESVATPSARWSHQEVLTLIDLWVKQQEQLKAAGRLKKSVYQQIEREMKDCGFPNKDWEQCRNKIRSLTRDYRTKGNEFIYYKEMDRVLQGRTPSVLPDSPNIEPMSKSPQTKNDDGSDYKQQRVSPMQASVRKAEVASHASASKETFQPGINTEPDYFTVIKKKDIAAAREETRKNIFKCIEKLNENAQDDQEVKTIYIGKSYLEQQGKKKFDPSKPKTWGTRGISDRYSDHKKNNRGEFLIVVAVVTRDSIKANQKRNETFKDPEEYVLMLERRLIAEFMGAATKRPILLNESKDQGKLTEEDKAGYVIYMTAIRGERLVTLEVDMPYAAAEAIQKQVKERKKQKKLEPKRNSEKCRETDNDAHVLTSSVQETCSFQLTTQQVKPLIILVKDTLKEDKPPNKRQESDEESNMETSLKPVIHEDTDGSDKENYQISDSDNHNAEDVAMDTCSDNDHDTEEASAAESDDEETNTMTIVRTQPGDDGLLKAVKQNQVSFTGHEKQVRTECDQEMPTELKDKHDLQASLPAVLAFNIRRSATKYDQRAKKYKGFSTGVLDELMEKYQISIRVHEEEWTSIVTINSTEQNIDYMYECREDFLQRLLPTLQFIQAKKKISLTEKDAYLEPTPPPQTQETQQKESINLDDLLYEGLPPVHIPSESDQSESDEMEDLPEAIKLKT